MIWCIDYSTNKEMFKSYFTKHKLFWNVTVTIATKVTQFFDIVSISPKPVVKALRFIILTNKNCAKFKVLNHKAIIRQYPGLGIRRWSLGLLNCLKCRWLTKHLPCLHFL